MKGSQAQVEYSPLALADLDAAWDWVESGSGSTRAAADVVTSIMARVDLLATFPLSGTPLSSICGICTDYRFVSAAGYIAFYHTAPGKVRVDRVLSARSDYLRNLIPDAGELDAWG